MAGMPSRSSACQSRGLGSCGRTGEVAGAHWALSKARHPAGEGGHDVEPRDLGRRPGQRVLAASAAPAAHDPVAAVRQIAQPNGRCAQPLH
jgi:hypothetical protein